MPGRAERAVGAAAAGFMVGLTAVGVLGWFVLLVGGALISLGEPAFLLPTLLWVPIVVPNLIAARREIVSLRGDGQVDDRSALPLILFALAVAAVAVVVGVMSEPDAGGTRRLVAVAWATAAFFGQVAFLRAFPAP